MSTAGILLLLCTGFVADAGYIPLFRYWNGDITDHFYTNRFSEIGAGKHGWVIEGVAAILLDVQASGSVPLYRYWGNNDHFYTTNANEIGSVLIGVKGRHNYVFERIVGYCFPTQVAGTAPLYRYYKKAGQDHFYTKNIHEIGTGTLGATGKHGYVSEGVACFVY
jgi:hypothetical protein